MSSTSRIIVIVLAVLLVTAAAVVLTRAARPPEISELTPHTVSPGEQVVVLGANFGQTGRVEIDSIGVSSEHILLWSDERILFRLPETANSGAVVVETMRGRSNPAFLVNRSQLPEDTGQPIGTARITGPPPTDALPGLPVVLEGTGFGPPTGSSYLEFPGRTGAVVRLYADDPMVVRWSDTSVEFLVPPEVENGVMRVVPLGFRPAETSITVSPVTANVEFETANQLGINQAVRFEQHSEDVRFWFPKPPVLEAQPIVQTLTIQGDVSDTLSSWWSFSLQENLPDGNRTGEIGATVLVRRRAVRVTVEEADLPDRFFLQDPVVRRGFAPYLASSVDVPADHKAISFRARQVVQNAPRGATELEIAYRLYQSVLDRLEPVTTGPSDPVEAVQEGGASACGYAGLVAAMFRSQGIPARRHAGVLVLDEGIATPHYWVEFFLLGYGWYPVDPALGDGMYREQTMSLDSFYGSDRLAGAFGALDDRRATLAVDGMEFHRWYPELPSTLPEESYGLVGPLAELSNRGAMPWIQWKPPRLLSVTRLVHN